MATLMTTWAQAGAGLALVMAFALLCIRQTSAASILLATQSAAVALSAMALHQPLMALPPVILAAGLWFAHKRTNTPDTRTMPVGGAKLGVGAGAVLAVLCQSQGSLALPLAVVLLAVLLAATRTQTLMRVMALVALQNGILLAACVVIQSESVSPWLLPLACLALPLPLAAFLLSPPLTSGSPAGSIRLGWVDLALSVAVFATTFIIPLDPLASVFAPLLGLDGVLRSEARRKPRDGIQGLAPRGLLSRPETTLAGRGLALLNSLFLVLAVCAQNPMTAWFAILAAMAATLLPTNRHHWDRAILASLGAGTVLFGLLLIAETPSIIGYLSLFAGLVTIAAVVPDLAVVSVILLLRLAIPEPWPPAAAPLGVGIALIALLSCAIILTARRRRIGPDVAEWATPVIPVSWPGSAGGASILTDPPQQVLEGWTNPSHAIKPNVRPSALMSGPMARVSQTTANPDTGMPISGDRATLLLLSQASIAALAICMGRPDGRFAALVLLILMILTRSAVRFTGGPVAALALAGLGGVPPLGVFPALVLVELTITGHDPWLLLPLGLAAIPILSAGLPRRVPDMSLLSLRSIAWVPLVLALLVGYCVPDGLSHWWHIITAGRP